MTITHELYILTNDGWVVTLVSNKPINIGEAVIETIIVQPVDDYAKRIAAGSDGIARHWYYLGTSGKPVANDDICGRCGQPKSERCGDDYIPSGAE